MVDGDSNVMYVSQFILLSYHHLCDFHAIILGQRVIVLLHKLLVHHKLGDLLTS